MKFRITGRSSHMKPLRKRFQNLLIAWDNAKQDLTRYFEAFKKQCKYKGYSKYGVYVLTNYDSTFDEDTYRVYKLRELGFDPYVMV